jgi:undecaprenyl-diphosphatase
MSILCGVAISIFGILIGLTWLFPNVQSLDARLFRWINRSTWKTGLDRLMVAIRFLGTKWPFWAIISALALWKIQSAPKIFIAAALMLLVERLIKHIVQRPRPFDTLSNVTVRQSPAPRDPSFPSGDATRVWYLCIFLGVMLSAGSFGWAIGIFLGMLINLSRIRLGSHYPLDVFAGTWLGFGLALLAVEWIG